MEQEKQNSKTDEQPCPMCGGKSVGRFIDGVEQCRRCLQCKVEYISSDCIHFND